MHAISPPTQQSSLVPSTSDPTLDYRTLMVGHLQKTAADTHQRQQQFAETKNPKHLLGGVWYTTDCYNAMNRIADLPDVQKRLKWFVDHHSFYTGYAPVKFFTRIQDTQQPTGYLAHVFEIRKDILPSQALDALEKEFSMLDCGNATYLAAFRALKQMLKPEKFDHLFAYDSPFRLRLSFNENRSLLNRLYSLVPLNSEEEVQQGDICYFSNIPDYVRKNPVGDWRGLNTACLDPSAKTYVFHGSPQEGATKSGIEMQLWEQCNTPPVDEGIHAPEIWKYLYSNYILGNEKESREAVASLRDKTFTWEEFQAMPPRKAREQCPFDGKLILDVMRPNMHRINALASAPLESIRQTFASYT